MKILTPVILICLVASLLICERLWPLRNMTRKYAPRLFINVLMGALMFFAAAIFVKPVGHTLINWNELHHWGLVNFIALPTWLRFSSGFLLMDLSFYYWHRMNHKIPLLWRFHNVHHVDPDMDVSTSFRFHFIEIAYSALFRIVQLGLIGITPLTFFIYEFVFQANTFIQHSNIRLPIRLERILVKIFVTPRMHGIHHSNLHTEVDTNFSTIFSVWDRLHKTLHLNTPQQEISIGVPAYTKTEDNKLWQLCSMPFRRQRKYWRVDEKQFETRQTTARMQEVSFLED